MRLIVSISASILLLFLSAFTASAQYDFSDVRFRKTVDMKQATWWIPPVVTVDPSGTATGKPDLSMVFSTASSHWFQVQSGVWVDLGGGGGGGSVTVPGTSGQVLTSNGSGGFGTSFTLAATGLVVTKTSASVINISRGNIGVGNTVYTFASHDCTISAGTATGAGGVYPSIDGKIIVLNPVGITSACALASGETLGLNETIAQTVTADPGTLGKLIATLGTTSGAFNTPVNKPTQSNSIAIEGTTDIDVTTVAGNTTITANANLVRANGSPAFTGAPDFRGATDTAPHRRGTGPPSGGSCTALKVTNTYTDDAIGGLTYYCQQSSSGTYTWASSSGGGSAARMKTDAITSTGTWTVPTGVVWAFVEAWGGGGGSPSGAAGEPGSGGGGGGGYQGRWCAFTPAASVTVTIGAGGAAGAGAVTGFNAAVDGGDTSISGCVNALGGRAGFQRIGGAAGYAQAAGAGLWLQQSTTRVGVGNGSFLSEGTSASVYTANSNYFLRGIDTQPGALPMRPDQGGGGGGTSSGVATAFGYSGGAGLMGGGGGGGGGGTTTQLGGAGGASSGGGAGGKGGDGATAGGTVCAAGTAPGGGGGGAGGSAGAHIAGCAGARGEVRITYAQ